jgi:hypothetical protein
MKKIIFDLKQYDEYRLHNPETKTFLGDGFKIHLL